MIEFMYNQTLMAFIRIDTIMTFNTFHAVAHLLGLPHGI